MVVGTETATLGARGTVADAVAAGRTWLRRLMPVVGFEAIEKAAEGRRFDGWREAAAVADREHAAMVGRRLAVNWISINREGGGGEWNAKAGKPFIVRLMPTTKADLHHDTGGYIDPYWDVEVIDARGVIPTRT